MPPAVERLARKYMRKPIVINIGRAGQATDNVTQRVIVSNGDRGLVAGWDGASVALSAGGNSSGAGDVQRRSSSP